MTLERHLKEFLRILNELIPNEDRDPNNYKNSLGLYLSTMGLDLSKISSLIFEHFALWPKHYYDDVLYDYDVMKLVDAIGDEATAELFYYLTLRIMTYSKDVSNPVQNNKVISPNEQKGRILWWLNGTRKARIAILQQAYELVAFNPEMPVEWQLEFISFDRLTKAAKG